MIRNLRSLTKRVCTLQRHCTRFLSAVSSSDQDYDYIIVGAGSAGCVLAHRLSADPNISVLLLEAGQDDSYAAINVPVGYLHCINNPRTDWMFNTTEQPGLNGRQLMYPRGKVLGGCSSINGMIYMRGQQADYDAWAEEVDDASWQWDALLPLWKQQQDYHGLHKREDPTPFNNNARYMEPDAARVRLHHGEGGPWTVSNQRHYSPSMNVFREAAIEQGIPATGDFNRGDNLGIAFFDVTQRKGRRLTAFQAFVAPVLAARPNLTLRTTTQVQHLLFEDAPGGKVVGSSSSSSSPSCTGLQAVHFKDNMDSGKGVDGTSAQYRARREVVLCAGSIGSVQILERSGIGDSEHLLSLAGSRPKIVADLPGVGANLQDHLQLRPVFGLSNMPTLNTDLQSLPKKVGMGLDFLSAQKGPLTCAPSLLGAFCPSSDKYADRPNVQFHIQPLSLERFGSNFENDGTLLAQLREALHTALVSPLDTFDAITASVTNVRPTSVGSCHITSTDVHAKPRIDPNYLSTEEDRAVAADSLRLMRRIVMDSKAFRPYSPREVRPTADCVTQEQLVAAAATLGTTIFHPVGTAKMGKVGDGSAVVDSKLRVRGVRNLRVADCSIMPNITSGNTAAPAMVIGDNCAKFILQSQSQH